jgi:hypothetical protein
MKYFFRSFTIERQTNSSLSGFQTWSLRQIDELYETSRRRDAQLDPYTSRMQYLQCTAPSRITWRIALLSKLRNQLSRTRTNEHLQEYIIDCIDKALSGRTITTTGPFQSALESQARIGWLGLIRGYWSTTRQQEYEQSYEEPAEETPKQKNK